jgi:hypothetical protein
MNPHEQELGTFAPPRPDFQTGGFTPLSRRRSQSTDNPEKAFRGFVYITRILENINA